MSDWLLQGVDPREPAGQEFYLHTADEWFDIVNIVDQVCLFPLAADNPLGWLETANAGGSPTTSTSLLPEAPS